jgi:hypothetical protein
MGISTSSSTLFAGPIFDLESNVRSDPIESISAGWTLPNLTQPLVLDGFLPAGRDVPPYTCDMFVAIFDDSGVGVRLGFEVNAIHGFLGKKPPAAHGAEQLQTHYLDIPTLCFPWIEWLTESATHRTMLSGNYSPGDFVMLQLWLEPTKHGGSVAHAQIQNATYSTILPLSAIPPRNTRIIGQHACLGIGRSANQRSIPRHGQFVVVDPLVSTKGGKLITEPSELVGMRNAFGKILPKGAPPGSEAVWPWVSGGEAYLARNVQPQPQTRNVFWGIFLGPSANQNSPVGGLRLANSRFSWQNCGTFYAPCGLDV